MNRDRRKRLQEICDILEEQQAALEEIRDEEQESFDNLPEGLQCTERGQALEESAGDLDSACSDLESLRDTAHPEISPLRRWWRLHFAKRIPGVCRVCGCTEHDPCHNPSHGYCWWHDAEMTLCSHCANKDIALDPDTVHCVNSNCPTDL